MSFFVFSRLILLHTRLRYVILEVQKCWYVWFHYQYIHFFSCASSLLYLINMPRFPFNYIKISTKYYKISSLIRNLRATRQKARCCSWRAQSLIIPTLESHNFSVGKSHTLQLDLNNYLSWCRWQGCCNCNCSREMVKRKQRIYVL